MGSASIGQVHAARLFDGRDVVLKVRKPRVDELVRIDLDILAGLIDEWSPRFPILAQYDARGLLREFSDALLAELDYGHEAANVKFFRDFFANEHGFKIPEVIEKYSKNRVLTEERVKGRKASDVADLPKRRRALISGRIARFVLEPAFEHGMFYADPHPGNLLMEDDGSLSVIDFGKIGRLTPSARRRAADLFLAIARSDGQRLADRLVEITAPEHPIDRALIGREIDRVLELYVDVSLEKLRFGDAIGEVLQLVRRHGLLLPGTLVYFFKALAMCEGVVQSIDPDSSFADYLQPMVRKLIYQAFAGPDLLGARVRVSVGAEVRPLREPRSIGRALSHSEKVKLLAKAKSRPEWQNARLATVLALNTTIAGCEIKNLRWRDVDLLTRVLSVRKSKTEAGEGSPD